MNKIKNTRGRSIKQLASIAGLTMLSLFISVGNVSAYEGDVDHIQNVKQDNNVTVKGHVTDETGEDLIGVSIKVQGSKQLFVTDAFGNFTATLPANSTLLLSYIGYKDKRVAVKAGEMNILMDVDAQLMEEVVIVGYGTQKKENLTGAVFAVDVSKTLDSRPIADVGRGLQGVVPGLNVTVPSGEIGSDAAMKIRGNIASINGSADPLILLDNVEIPSIQLVNPDDIASISVLKDAAASSIYGAKAAFGVVLITSKQGSKTEKIDVSYSNNFSFQDLAKKIKMGGVNGLEYALESYERSGQTFGGAAFKVNRASLERAKQWQQDYGGKIGMNDPYVYGRDWYYDGNFRYGVRQFDPADFMLDKWTPTHTHNINVNGTVKKTTFNIGLGLLDQKSMLKPAKADDFRRYNASVRINTEINKYLSVRAGAIYSNRRKRSPYTGGYQFDPWYYMYRWGPITPWGADEYGNEMRSPALEMRQANTASRENRYTNISLGLTLNLLKNWDVKVDYTYALDESSELYPGTRFTGVDIFPGSKVVGRVDGFGNDVYVDQHGNQVDPSDPDAMRAYDHEYRTYTAKGTGADRIERKSRTDKQNTWNVYSTYGLDLGQEKEHKFKFMAGMNRVTFDSDDSWAAKTELFDPLDPQMNSATGKQTSGGGSAWKAQLGFFGRLNYSFKDRYLVEANFRHDGSSSFPKGKKWESFPSFSAGWIASEESFMKPLNPVLSFTKFRGSWGSIGDQSVATRLYMPIMASRNTNWLGADDKLVAFATPTDVRDTKWQKIETLDVGADFRFWKDKIGVTVDWYQRTTKNMIAGGRTLPLSYGQPIPQGNNAELRTRGWEISVDFRHTFANGLTISGTGAFYDSKSVYSKFADENAKSVDGLYKGKVHGEIWGYKTDRLFQESDFIRDPSGRLVPHVISKQESEKYAGREVWMQQGGNVVYQPFLEASYFKFGPGDVKFQDLNGDGVIDDGGRAIDDHGDLAVIGNSTPRYEYSFKLGADFKGVDFSIFFQGIGSRKIWGNGPLAIPGYGIGDGAIPNTFAKDYWTPENTGAFYPRPVNMGSSNNQYNMVQQSKYLLDMSYLRIKNITVGYTFPKEWIKKAMLSQARVYMSLENFFTFDNLKGLPIDPEAVPGGNMFTSNYNAGRVGVGTPTFRSLSFGIQLNF